MITFLGLAMDGKNRLAAIHQADGRVDVYRYDGDCAEERPGHQIAVLTPGSGVDLIDIVA